MECKVTGGAMGTSVVGAVAAALDVARDASRRLEELGESRLDTTEGLDDEIENRDGVVLLRRPSE